MIRKIFIVVFTYCVALPAFACPNALPTNHPSFCASFKTAATCYCVSSGLPAGMCQDMNALYSRMISVFGSLQKACESQRYTTPQDCMDNWNCYLYGGVDSRQRLCSGTRAACQ
ncbi:Uncharacterised protein [Legionella lansingensis]|uniref:Lipoprotein n=1 Tax=Legionella lansingensis TaxID=45067 RepID=A0A0W0VUS3_9GAMM|nr:hypothetical protein [Legionella lansingensis]KTD23818.1 hypothetical protein Llan_0599 [Legionella lansingensis]SNV46867.1 Uncharacterised protein [Legionella lansingensis]